LLPAPGCARYTTGTPNYAVNGLPVDAGGFTLAEVRIETGRKHQIRAHAQWLGYPVVGDKIYGPDARCYLEFIDRGWTPALAARLLHERQALHCLRIELEGGANGEGARTWRAPLAPDLVGFCAARLGAAALAAAEAAGRDTGADKF
jgi:23S rRNA pseudouridine1911/1915/1917 synthase